MQLVDQVFSYTRDTIAAFAREGVMPDTVQVGNEITQGMIWPDGKLPDNWDNIERSGDYDAAVWFLDNLIAHHVLFDVIGISCYPRWHGGVAKLRGSLHDLALRYQHPIIIVETAYNWTPGDFIGKKSDFPESPAGQADLLRAVDAAVRSIPRGLGQGVFWWEPAAEGVLQGKGFFDSDGNVLPVIGVLQGKR